MTNKEKLPFGKINYTLMLAGIAIILIGFFIMSLDKTEFGFGFLGLTLGPIIVLSGFALEFFAMVKRHKYKAHLISC
jgi:membrane-bound ClpP family serine protease